MVGIGRRFMFFDGLGTQTIFLHDARYFPFRYLPPFLKKFFCDFRASISSFLSYIDAFNLDGVLMMMLFFVDMSPGSPFIVHTGIFTENLAHLLDTVLISMYHDQTILHFLY